MLPHTSVLDVTKPNITITEQTLQKTRIWGFISDLDAVPTVLSANLEKLVRLKTFVNLNMADSLQMHDVASSILCPLLSPTYTCVSAQKGTSTSTLNCHPGVK